MSLPELIYLWVVFVSLYECLCRISLSLVSLLSKDIFEYILKPIVEPLVETLRYNPFFAICLSL